MKSRCIFVYDAAFGWILTRDIEGKRQRGARASQLRASVFDEQVFSDLGVNVR